MNFEPPPGQTVVLQTQQRHELFENRLVLDAAGIPVAVYSEASWWYLVVASADAARATEELAAYRHENVKHASEFQVATPTFDGAPTGVLIYAAIIILIYFLSVQSAFGVQWYPAGHMQAGSVVAGQWWRVFTALTLHVDALHLGGNLIFGALFGYLAGQVLGGGVAWLVIVLAGGLGNFINALAQLPEHTSIGASTAVFAALGVIVAHAIRPSFFREEKLLRRWSPLVGGVLLLAFIGVGGENTDVVAHVTGFLAGLLVGRLGFLLPQHWLALKSVQVAAGLLALVVIMVTWCLALNMT